MTSALKGHRVHGEKRQLYLQYRVKIVTIEREPGCYGRCDIIYSKKNGKGDGTPLQYSCLENLMDGEAWWEESDTAERLHFHFSFHALENEMATCSSVLVWRIPGTGEPGGLPSMGSHRVGHD